MRRSVSHLIIACPMLSVRSALRGEDSVPAGTFHGEDSVPAGTFHGEDSVPAGTFHGEDSVPAGTFHGEDSVPAGTFHGEDSVPAGTFHGEDSVPAGTFHGEDSVPAGTFHGAHKSLTVTTTKGAQKVYSITSAGSGPGYNVHRMEPGLFGSTRRFIGHGGSLPNAVLIARMDVGENLVKSTKLYG